MRAPSLFLVVAVLLAGSGCTEPVPIPDLAVAGPSADFEMGSRLMTSSKKMEVRLTIPGKGTVRIPKFNGTFFYRESEPQATTGTLLFRPDQFEDLEGSLAAELVQAFEFDEHPFFAFQSRSASTTPDGIDLEGRLIVKDRQADVTLRLRSPGPVAVDAEGDRWVEIGAELQADAHALGLGALGDVLLFDFDLFLRGYTVTSVEKTGVDVAALNRSPPELPSGADALSDAAWYLMLNDRFPEAIEVFDRSIAKDPSNVNTYLRRGDAYLFDGQYGKAMGTYRAMAEFLPVHPHIMELAKVLDQEYLTPATLHDANQRWVVRQSR